MKNKKSKCIVSFFIVLLLILSPSTFLLAESQLSYSGNQSPEKAIIPNAEPAASQVVPVSYQSPENTTNAQYPSAQNPTYTFMQSPYADGGISQGGLVAQYPGASTPGAKNRTGSPSDPYAASEISPYSRYSPYIEVVGEGTNYTLGIDDVVTVIVRGQPEFSGRYVVDPYGNIQYNFVGDIKAIGLTKDQVKIEITNRLIDFIRYPEVAVMISEYRSKAVYVYGFVNRPGKYAMKGDTISVQEAVVAAGLPRFDAKMGSVHVIRPSQFTGNGKAKHRTVNLRRLLHKGDSTQNYLLEPGDTIVVDQRFFDRFINTFSRIVGPVFQSVALYDLGQRIADR